MWIINCITVFSSQTLTLVETACHVGLHFSSELQCWDVGVFWSLTRSWLEDVSMWHGDGWRDAASRRQMEVRMTDLNPRALCTLPDSLGSSTYLASFCVGLGANWEHELTQVTVVLSSLLPSLPPWGSHPPTFLSNGQQQCVGSSLLRTECVLGVTAFSRIRPWPQSFLASRTSEFGVQEVDSSLWWRDDLCPE